MWILKDFLKAGMGWEVPCVELESYLNKNSLPFHGFILQTQNSVRASVMLMSLLVSGIPPARGGERCSSALGHGSAMGNVTLGGTRAAPGHSHSDL